jgi:hypothetical protein
MDVLRCENKSGMDALPIGAGSLPYMFGAGLTAAAKGQLRRIVECGQALDVLAKAFFEAALIAAAKGASQSDIVAD